ncbi:MAG: outer membrane beta-barrel protein [Bacteroidales bacterium]
MKRQLCLFLIVVLGSTVYAQSESSKFIDSPATVIQALSRSQGEEYTNAKKPKEKAKSSVPVKKKLVYTSIQLTPLINWYANINRPFDREGVRVTVTPALTVDFNLGHHMFLGTGLVFNTTGGRLSYPADYINAHQEDGFKAYSDKTRSYAISYIEIPIQFKAQTNPFGSSSWAFFGSLGVHFGVKVRAIYKDLYKDFKYEDVQDGILIEGNLLKEGKLGKTANLWNVSGVLKMGVSCQAFKAVGFTMGLEYHYGFTNTLSTKHERPDGVRAKVKNQQMGVFLGIVF